MPTPSETAELIAGELARQAREARDARLETLAYLIEMARLEAGNSAKAVGPISRHRRRLLNTHIPG